jgi:hypothetical protein
VLIDCPGSANVLSAALAAADRALVVAQPTLKELEGLPALEQTIAKVASLYNTALKSCRRSSRASCRRPRQDGSTPTGSPSCGLYAELVTSPIRQERRRPGGPAVACRCRRSRR